MLLLAACTPVDAPVASAWFGTGLADGLRVDLYLAVSDPLLDDARAHAIGLLDDPTVGDTHVLYQIHVEAEAVDARPDDLPPLLAEAPGYLVWCGQDTCGDDAGGDLRIRADAGSCDGATSGPLPMGWSGRASATDLEAALDTGPTACVAPDAWVLEAWDPTG